MSAIVQFENVGLRYGLDSETLSDVSFSLHGGGFYFLTGASGAGKSTVASLLLRFWDPRTGAVKLDGVDVRRLRLDALREHLGLTQDDMAGRLGISQSAYAQQENSNRLRKSSRERIAAALCIEAAQLDF
mgnify:CR=1 FL=1